MSEHDEHGAAVVDEHAPTQEATHVGYAARRGEHMVPAGTTADRADTVDRTAAATRSTTTIIRPARRRG